MRAECRYAVCLFACCLFISNAGAARAPLSSASDLIISKRLASLNPTSVWQGFRWPEGVSWQPILRAVRWQGCPLDAVLFQSHLAPSGLAQRWVGLAPTSPALLWEPEALWLHWYASGRHWVVSLTPAANGGTAGSVSALALDVCLVDESRPAVPDESEPLFVMHDQLFTGGVPQMVSFWMVDPDRARQRWRERLHKQGWRETEAEALPGWQRWERAGRQRWIRWLRVGERMVALDIEGNGGP